MGARVRKAAAPGERLLGGPRAGRPHPGARGGASQDSGVCRCCRGRQLVAPASSSRRRRRHSHPVPRARPGSPSGLPATNGRSGLARQQPITGGAATPHTPLSWKQPRHPRPAALATPPALARATPPPTSQAEKPERGRTQSARAAEPPPAHLQSRPVRGLRFRKSERSPVTLSLLPYKGPPLCPGRAESAQGLLGVVVYPPEPSFPFSFPRPSWNYGVDGEVYSLAFHHKTDQLWNYCTQFSSLGTVFGVA